MSANAAPAPEAIDDQMDGADITAKTILIVDDSPLIRNLLTNFVQEMGLLSLEAGNAADALAIIRSSKPALVLMDIVMPGANGVEALQQIRDDPAIADVPVIAVTTLAGGPSEDDFITAGFDAYIPKPLNLNRFAEAVRRHIR
ncbi:MAG: response regulator [Alphaproteobacteria bacterium]|jgi:two-component system, cell cycle response regulator DivK|nr:response regulator [Alphaproteobacteria bacterium]